MSEPSIAVIGGGAWGTALGTMAARNGNAVRLYARSATTVDSINKYHRNETYLPGIDLHPALTASIDAREVLAGIDVILCVIPAQALADALQELKNLIPVAAPLVICAKGIERHSGQLMSELVARIMPDQTLGALSGPSFATDVARGLPTAVTVAARSQALADRIALILSGPTFRCYSTDDLIGVEIGGALKNVLAIAAGAAIGRGFGASAQAALVTRGFVELRRIGEAMGARPETIMGLSGLGDLMLTCSTPQSRNYSYGLALGRGEDLTGRPLAEGVATAAIAAELAVRNNIEAPIIATVAQILDRHITIDEAMEALLARPLKNES
ncbi:NAD(P)H-dependent glycerol-3-phosphate dehydrogenase [Phyllobacterium zundukense]|uniref:NAD(P)H-dependent glycerol-3-phosphate dehydrogenase n=1 Tax=Phyllobacterium zundukense TaxID=1867719 RepID=A0ACD4D847_9HYPH|nr:NAD(P)H-dependent glycerol-3-phosphate dehydrogenase [Phyllobacterium zundukense]UXN61981.1 NAD(P)H-dependent glycerol-3-phosphate dehydrogenase [Phyllobacterium zundukense]